MKHVHKFFNFFKDKDEIPKEQKIKNENILRKIYDIDIWEGDFNPQTWKRPGNLIPNEKRNDELITTYDGISLSFDLNNKTYELSIPVKYSDNFKYKIKKVISNEYFLNT
jgi:hypothetical protein